ncbi:TetR/AcrR family transcriptional regulator [Helcococcus kunzii]|uniref:TetR/AcrR family transcriptional regulator n=1 Tax=Helcococcus kunzii TaxID=40091 RepID=UPI0038AD2E35
MKKTFLNLSEEKKNTIIDAIKDEFLVHPFSDASVASIIDKAGISRGSFYQYFENLEEAYFYILDLFTKDTHEIFFNLLKENNFEYKKALEIYGNVLFEEMLQDEVYNLYKFKYLNWTQDLEEKHTKYLVENYGDEKKSSALLSEREDMMFIKAVVHDLVCRLFSENWTKEEFLEKYNLYCEWIIKGVNYGRTI